MISYRKIQLVCVFYIIVWMLAPPLAYGTIFRVMAIIAAAIWILLQLIVRNNDVCDITVSYYIKWYKILSIVYILFLFCFRIIFDKLTIFSAFYQDIPIYILIFVGYLASSYIKNKRYNDLKKIFILTLIIAVVFSLTTMLKSDVYDGLTRNAGGEGDAAYLALAKEAAMHGVGAFGFFCFTSVFAPILLWYILSPVVKHKMILYLSFLIIELGVISAGYTLALLISFIGICTIIIMKSKNLGIKFFVIFMFFFLILFWKESLSFLYGVIKNIASGSMYANKVDDIFSFLLEGESAGSFAARQERYLISWNSILSNPIIGSYILEGTRAVGYHSSVLDTFAAYGWGVGFSWVYLTNIFPVKISMSVYKGYRIITFFLLFFTSLFNTYTMTMGVFYFVIPCVSIICNENIISTKTL